MRRLKLLILLLVSVMTNAYAVVVMNSNDEVKMHQIATMETGALGFKDHPVYIPYSDYKQSGRALNKLALREITQQVIKKQQAQADSIAANVNKRFKRAEKALVWMGVGLLAAENIINTILDAKEGNFERTFNRLTNLAATNVYAKNILPRIRNLMEIRKKDKEFFSTQAMYPGDRAEGAFNLKKDYEELNLQTQRAIEYCIARDNLEKRKKRMNIDIDASREYWKKRRAIIAAKCYLRYRTEEIAHKIMYSTRVP